MDGFNEGQMDTELEAAKLGGHILKTSLWRKIAANHIVEAIRLEEVGSKEAIKEAKELRVLSCLILESLKHPKRS